MAADLFTHPGESMRQLTVLAAVLALPLAVPFDADAQSFRCTSKDGKKYYGATIPRQCIGMPVEQLSAQGVVIRRIEGQISPEERARRDAEAKEAAERDAQAKEDARRNRALLATYQSENDVEIARKRALSDNDKALKEIEVRMGQIRKRQDDLQKEMEFFKGKNKPPARLEDDIKRAAQDLKLQQDLFDQKKREVTDINARYDEDKKRFLELVKGGGVVPAPAVSAKPSATR